MRAPVAHALDQELARPELVLVEVELRAAGRSAWPGSRSTTSVMRCAGEDRHQPREEVHAEVADRDSPARTRRAAGSRSPCRPRRARIGLIDASASPRGGAGRRRRATRRSRRRASGRPRSRPAARARRRGGSGCWRRGPRPRGRPRAVPSSEASSPRSGPRGALDVSGMCCDDRGHVLGLVVAPARRPRCTVPVGRAFAAVPVELCTGRAPRSAGGWLRSFWSVCDLFRSEQREQHDDGEQQRRRSAGSGSCPARS